MKVFISYATEDRDIATNIGQILDDLAIDYFLDVKDINWGDNVLTTIHGGIRKSSHLVLVVSPASAKSRPGAKSSSFMTARLTPTAICTSATRSTRS